jgi:hypothetical protein
MADRRTFLKGTAALTAAPAMAGAAGARAAGGAAGVGGFVFDERFPAARALAEAMQAKGVAAHAIRGDVTELWLGRLDTAWRGAARPLAGVTDANALFVLERLAWDRRLRVVYRTEAPVSAAAVGAWSASAAKALLQGEAWRATTAPEPPMSRFGGGEAQLYAWVIAPMARAKAPPRPQHAFLPEDGGERREI